MSKMQSWMAATQAFNSVADNAHIIIRFALPSTQHTTLKTHTGLSFSL
jgi:hypothetical protein